MTPDTSRIIDHYTRSDLLDRIRAALGDAGYDPDNPTVEALSELDHLHGGGFATTEAQVALAGIPRGAHVLDAGCGIGGPSRYLAAAHGCTVEGIDLTPEYVETATLLNDAVGLGDRITLAVASVTALPHDDARFEAVICQNVTMNVADKPAMFREAFRVLKPGGIYTISHTAEGPNGPPIYPAPWAMTPETSFLGTPDSILAALEAAGFTAIEDRVRDDGPNPGGAPAPNTIGGAPAMGDDMPERIANSARSIEEGRLIPMMIVARRPG